jgi:preprotein translocase subunit YajC
MSLLAGAAPANPPVNETGQHVYLAGVMLIFGVMFYFLFIRPQSKKTREHADMMKALRPGDKVLTSGGLLAVVIAVKDKSVSVRSGDSKLEVQKGAITEILERSSEATPS